MIDPRIEALQAAIKVPWGSALVHSNDKKDKVWRYVGKFLNAPAWNRGLAGKS